LSKNKMPLNVLPRAPTALCMASGAADNSSILMMMSFICSCRNKNRS
jgi:hypothetical protein